MYLHTPLDLINEQKTDIFAHIYQEEDFDSFALYTKGKSKETLSQDEVIAYLLNMYPESQVEGLENWAYTHLDSVDFDEYNYKEERDAVVIYLDCDCEIWLNLKTNTEKEEEGWY